MSDIWSIFAKKINNFNRKIIQYSASIIKNIISYSKIFSKSSIDKIEINKLKWKLKKEKERLGSYIYESNLNNIYNFYNDLKFQNFIKKIKEIKFFLNNKENSN